MRRPALRLTSVFSPARATAINDGVAGTVLTAQSADSANNFHPGCGNDHGVAFN
jgi:hypothetical protein